MDNATYIKGDISSEVQMMRAVVWKTCGDKTSSPEGIYRQTYKPTILYEKNMERRVMRLDSSSTTIHSGNQQGIQNYIHGSNEIVNWIRYTVFGG